MTQMAEYVFELYTTQMETIKDQLPLAIDLEGEKNVNLPVEVTPTTSTENFDVATETTSERPRKNTDNDKKIEEPSKTPAKLFKRSTIINEISIDDEEMQERESKDVNTNIME